MYCPYISHFNSNLLHLKKIDKNKNEDECKEKEAMTKATCTCRYMQKGIAMNYVATNEAVKHNMKH